ncbi:MAG: MerR family transcriptional regulator [Sphingomicrobium sp.]
MTPKLYKAGEVCDMAQLQPYVLRSWEKEFPGIGVQKSADSPRLYRQADVDQVVRIKQLVFSEGLTLAGARRRLEDVPSAPSRAADTQSEMDEVLDVLGADARARIAAVRSGLRSILEALSKAPGSVTLAAVARESGANGNGTSRTPPARRKMVAAKRAAPTKRASAARKSARTAKKKRASA